MSPDSSSTTNRDPYEGIRADHLAVMPLPTHTSSRVFGDGSTTDFVRERDFQSMLPDIVGLDMMDPRNQALLSAKARAPTILDRSAVCSELAQTNL